MGAQFFAIAGNTLTESIRQPIYTVLLMIGSLCLILNPSISAYSMEHGGDIQMLITMGLSMVAVMTLMLAAFTATSVLSEEIDNRTVLTVVSKPVPRPLFLIAKFAGVAIAIILAFYLFSLVLLLTVRHGVMQTASDHFDQPVITFGVLAGFIALFIAAAGNYYHQRVFTSTFVWLLAITLSLAFALVMLINADWQLQSPITQLQMNDWQMGHVIVGLIIIGQAMVIVTALAIVCSTRLGRLPTLLICAGVTLLGLVSNSINGEVDRRLNIPSTTGTFESFGAIFQSDVGLHAQLAAAAGKVLYLIVPNFQFLWPADAIFEGNPFTVMHVAKLTLYALGYTAALLCMGVILFQEREVG